ncbi:MAG: hypothetical protein ACPLRW_07775 [Moorellales bacterium]
MELEWKLVYSEANSKFHLLMYTAEVGGKRVWKEILTPVKVRHFEFGKPVTVYYMDGREFGSEEELRAALEEAKYGG